jgi:hypothetical protein
VKIYWWEEQSRVVFVRMDRIGHGMVYSLFMVEKVWYDSSLGYQVWYDSSLGYLNDCDKSTANVRPKRFLACGCYTSDRLFFT